MFFDSHRRDIGIAKMVCYDLFDIPAELHLLLVFFLWIDPLSLILFF